MRTLSPGDKEGQEVLLQFILGSKVLTCLSQGLPMPLKGQLSRGENVSGTPRSSVPAPAATMSLRDTGTTGCRGHTRGPGALTQSLRLGHTEPRALVRGITRRAQRLTNRSSPRVGSKHGPRCPPPPAGCARRAKAAQQRVRQAAHPNAGRNSAGRGLPHAGHREALRVQSWGAWCTRAFLLLQSAQTFNSL